MGVLDAITGIATAGTGIGNTILGFKNYEYMKDMQQEAWKREDNAVQRRANDLEQAGLSKTLAAGSSASTMAPIRLEAPQISDGVAEAIPKSLGAAAQTLALLRQKKEIAQTEAQTDLIKKQAEASQVAIDDARLRNPETLKGVSLKNQLQENSMNDTLKSLSLDVQRKGFEQTLQELNRRVIQAKVSDAEWQNTLQTLRRDKEFQQLKKIEQDVIAKQITIKLAEMNKEERARNLHIYRESGMLSDQSLGPIGALSTSLSGQIMRAAKSYMQTIKEPPAPKKNSDSV